MFHKYIILILLGEFEFDSCFFLGEISLNLVPSLKDSLSFHEKPLEVCDMIVAKKKG